jgi:uncharacterized membrane protein YqjE
MEDGAKNEPGVLGSLRRLLRTILRIAENRLDLLLVELHEARWQFIYSVLVMGLALILALMTLLVPTLAIVLICVIAKRYDLVVLLTLAYLAATSALFWHLRTRLKRWAPFSATVAELKKDKACLDEKN